MDEKIKEVATQIDALLKTNNLRMAVNQGIVLLPNDPVVPVPEPAPPIVDPIPQPTETAPEPQPTP